MMLEERDAAGWIFIAFWCAARQTNTRQPSCVRGPTLPRRCNFFATRCICIASDSFATGSGNETMPGRSEPMRAGGRLIVAATCIVAGIVVAWTVHQSSRVSVPEAATLAAPRAATAPAAATSVLWLLSIGVSRYRQPDFNLQFAGADAQAIATVLQRQGDGPLYREAKTLVLTDEEVTRESILDSLERFLGQAGP